MIEMKDKGNLLLGVVILRYGTIKRRLGLHMRVSSTVFPFAAAAAISLFSAESAIAQAIPPYEGKPVFGHYGGVGLIKTRSARMAPDSTLSAGVAWTDPIQRYSLNFQAAPWLETTFSYAGFSTPTGDTFDRQFDVKVRLWEERLYLPEVAVGLQDFLGTGLFAGEYIVASKRLGPLDLSLGVGWGRLSDRAVASNPLGEISDRFRVRDTNFGQGGEINFGQFLQGEDIGVFGGVVYDTPIDGLRIIAEYDSDQNNGVEGLEDNPFNFGISYNPTPGIQIGASYIAGDEIALNAAFSTQTGEWVRDDPPGDAPSPFYVREAQSDADGGLDGLIAPVQPLIFTPVSRADLSDALTNGLLQENIKLTRMQVGTDTLRVVVSNGKYRSYAKAAGRTVRVLSRYAPADIDRFLVAFDQRGLETAEFLFDRGQLEKSASEVGYSVAPPSLAFSYITPNSIPVVGEETVFSNFPDYTYSFGPDVRLNTFDPDDPLRAQLDLELKGTVRVTRNLSFSAALGTDIIGNFDNDQRASNSVLPRVRTEFARYNEETDVGVYQLIGEYFFNAGPNIYGRLMGGLIEQSFGGFGGELLYRPSNSRLAWGLEAFYVKQREFDTLFTFQDYEVFTGFASVYWDTPYNNWNVAVHAGRYLARDFGATLEVKRRFPNGWEIGAFATLTDVPFDEFGEGSFDKGLTLKIPFDWGLSRDTQSAGNVTLRPIQRDGGQRLRVPNRLFSLTQPVSRGEVASQWATFAH